MFIGHSLYNKTGERFNVRINLALKRMYMDILEAFSTCTEVADT